LRRALSQDLMRLGLDKFIQDVLAPLNRLVGEQWARGSFAVFEEHLYTEVVQNLMRNAISTMHHPRSQLLSRPRVMLSTLPQEAHGLGLLMAEAVFSMEGAHCVSLGVQTPVMEILRAAQMQRADIVALSLSEAMNPRHALEALNELAAATPAEIEIWIGGHCPAVKRVSHERIHAIDLGSIANELAQWRLRSGRSQQQA
jgi:methanogenic corrinoid protein MtbC1